MPELRLRGGEVDGLSLHYLVEGRGPAVILLHGLGGFAASWRHNITPLAARATVYSLDLPGFGRSAKPRAHYGLPYFARALHGFLDALGVSQASLIGHSLGGAVAVAYALTHPTRVERLALLGSVVPGFTWHLSWRHRLVCTSGLGELVTLCGCAPMYRAAIAACFHVPDPAEVDFLVGHDYGVRTAAPARVAGNDARAARGAGRSSSGLSPRDQHAGPAGDARARPSGSRRVARALHGGRRGLSARPRALARRVRPLPAHRAPGGRERVARGLRGRASGAPLRSR